MKLCDVCFKNYDDNKEIHRSDNCTKTNCNGKIIEVEDKVSFIFVSLTKKNYQIKFDNQDSPLITIANGFAVTLFPLANDELLPPLPNGFTKQLSSDSIIIARELKSTEPNEQQIEKVKILNDFSKWIENLSPIVMIYAKYLFQSKHDMENSRDKLLKYGNYGLVEVLEIDGNNYLIETCCRVKYFKRREEFMKIFNSFEEISAKLVQIIELRDLKTIRIYHNSPNELRI